MDEKLFNSAWKIQCRGLAHEILQSIKTFLASSVHTNSAFFVVSTRIGAAISKNPHTNLFLKEQDIKKDRGSFFDCGRCASEMHCIFSSSCSTPCSEKIYLSTLTRCAAKTHLFRFIFRKLPLMGSNTTTRWFVCSSTLLKPMTTSLIYTRTKTGSFHRISVIL